MSPEQWQQAKSLFNRAVELAPEKRASFIERERSGALVSAAVKDMLAADEADNFDETPVVNLADLWQDADAEEIENFVGKRIGNYKIEREIGRGGMGVVFEAAREGGDFSQVVALKLLKRGMDSAAMLRRFRGERQILASLEHPNIARLLDGGMTPDGLPFFALELVEGAPLDEFCREQNLSVGERLRLFRQICAAVSFAHSRLVVHRDLKPTNILVTKDGVPKLLDFGIAKILSDEAENGDAATVTKLGMMTPQYASPEQARGEMVTTESDVYSLGLILYGILTNRAAYEFAGSGADEIARVICEVEPKPPSSVAAAEREKRKTNGANDVSATADFLPNETTKPFVQNPKLLRGDLDNIVLKALRKEPNRRYASVEQFSEDVRRHLEGLPVTARPTTISYRLEKFVARNRGVVAAGVLLFLTLCAGIAATAWQAARAERERSQAEKRFNQVRALANNVVFKYHDGIANLQGSTEVRKMLVGDATAYLDNLSQDAGGDAELMRETANAYIKLADVQGKTFYSNLGDTAGAVENYEKAVGLLVTLRGKSPDDAAVAGDLRSLYATLSTLEVRRQDWTRAVEYARKALDLSRDLASREPQNKEFQRLLARSYIAYGDAVLFTEGYDVRMRNFRISNALLENLLNADETSETVRRTITSSYQRIGTALEEVGEIKRQRQAAPEAVQADFAEALEFHRRTQKIAEGLHGDFPLNEDYDRAVGSTNMNVGSALARMGKGEESLAYFKRALEIMREISRKDPENKEAARDYAEALEYSAMGFAAADQTNQAVALFRQSLDTLKPLTVADRTNFEFLGQTHSTYNLLGDLLFKEHREEQALDAYRAGLNFLEQFSNEQTNGQVAVLFSDSYERLGKYYLQTGKGRNDIAAAKNYFDKSIGKLRELQAAKNLSKANEYKLDLLDSQMKNCESENTVTSQKNRL